jgi:hypothetical protein
VRVLEIRPLVAVGENLHGTAAVEVLGHDDLLRSSSSTDAADGTRESPTPYRGRHRGCHNRPLHEKATSHEPSC